MKQKWYNVLWMYVWFNFALPILNYSEMKRFMFCYFIGAAFNFLRAFDPSRIMAIKGWLN